MRYELKSYPYVMKILNLNNIYYVWTKYFRNCVDQSCF
jgi:hypothetical protein